MTPRLAIYSSTSQFRAAPEQAVLREEGESGEHHMPVPLTPSETFLPHHQFVCESPHLTIVPGIRYRVHAPQHTVVEESLKLV